MIWGGAASLETGSKPSPPRWAEKGFQKLAANDAPETSLKPSGIQKQSAPPGPQHLNYGSAPAVPWPHRARRRLNHRPPAPPDQCPGPRGRRRRSSAIRKRHWLGGTGGRGESPLCAKGKSPLCACTKGNFPCALKVIALVCHWELGVCANGASPCALRGLALAHLREMPLCAKANCPCAPKENALLR